MILKTSPSEIPRLKRYDKLFQIVTWAVISTAYIFSWLPLNLPINRDGVHLVIILAALSEFFAYNIMPFEKKAGFIKYSYKLKALIIGILNHFLISAYLISTGGIQSPFFYIYYLPLVAASIYLPLWAVLVEFFEVLALYPIFAILIGPLVGAPTPVFWSLSLMPINIAAATFIISLSYPQATEIAKESEENLKLAEKISKQSAEIEAERNKLKVVISAISDGVLALDCNTRIILVNEAVKKITGLEDTEIIGKPVDEVIQIFDEEKRVSSVKFCPITQIYQDKVVYAGENLKMVANNHTAYVNLTSATIREAAAANLGCIITFQDVTRQRELEEMKIDFVSMAVHELRTPLTAIRGYIAFLEDELAKKISPQEWQDLQRVKIAAKKLASLIENLLNVSRIERGAIKLEIAPTNWEGLVKSVVDEFQDQAKEKGLKLTFEKPKTQIPDVAVDRFRISEVLSNLLANAINFTHKGKVRVEIKKVNGEVRTSVSDTGPGIPASAVPKLFTKFFRVSGILEQGSKGTGLGLFIAKSIVDLHQGKIGVETKFGQGSTFSFTVPVYDKKFENQKFPLAKTKPVITN